jgi:beta-glucosidase
MSSPVPTSARYLDASASLEERLDDLLPRMTLEEKVAQLTSASLRVSAATEEGLAEVGDVVRDSIAHGIGQIENTFDFRTPRASVEEVNSIQKLLRENTRLKIPALIGSECAHGNAGYNSTNFPVPLAMASSWNPDLVQRAFDIAARESRARGGHEAHSPVLDLGRDPRWGRIEETFGEDTYLTTQMGVAAITGLQGGTSGHPDTQHVIASPKHFAGYGQVAGGRNFAATPIDTKTLYDEILPPFEAAVKVARTQGMMASHCDVDGVPAHGNRWLLTELLRDQWGFEGMVVSDYYDVLRLDIFHHVAANVNEAAKMALLAGMDLDLPAGVAYATLTEVIRKEPSLEPILDQSVRRILRLKLLLGLFENPFVDPDEVEQIVGHPTHRQIAQDLAEECITLLKNNGELLPLNPNALRSIAVIGPNAASIETGGYSMPHDDVVSILAGITDLVGPEVDVRHVEGCKIADIEQINLETVFRTYNLADELPQIERAVTTAQSSDVAIVCVGGNIKTAMEAFFVPGIRGDRATLDLLGNQRELVHRILATGTPTVIVLMGGRPYSIPDIIDRAPAVLNCFYLGQCHGTAIAKVLFGQTNPSGRLPVTVAESVGQLPVYYSQKAVSFYKAYLDEKAGPLFPFGFGLSYTTFVFSDLKTNKPIYKIGEPIVISIIVTNTGSRHGAEVVQVYCHDEIASVVRPDQLLVRFTKVRLDPDQSTTVMFTLEAQQDLSFTGIGQRRTVEPGRFEIRVGQSSQAIAQRITFELR